MSAVLDSHTLPFPPGWLLVILIAICPQQPLPLKVAGLPSAATAWASPSENDI